MYEIQETCDNCKFANFFGDTIVCSNEKSIKYNKEISISGKCSKYAPGFNIEEEKKIFQEEE